MYSRQWNDTVKLSLIGSQMLINNVEVINTSSSLVQICVFPSFVFICIFRVSPCSILFSLFWNHFRLINYAAPVLRLHSIGGGIKDHIVVLAVGSGMQL